MFIYSVGPCSAAFIPIIKFPHLDVSRSCDVSTASSWQGLITHMKTHGYDEESMNDHHAFRMATQSSMSQAHLLRLAIVRFPNT